MFTNTYILDDIKRIFSKTLQIIPLIVLTTLVFPQKPVQAAVVNKCGNITANETWTSDNVYVLTCSVTVNNGVTVTIQAGTVVKFNYDGYGYTSLTVNGVLDVQGTAASRVVFTSYRDDLNGGDTNNDGSATTPAPGDWQGIYLYNSAITLNYTLIQYAGGYKNPSYALTIDNASPTISNNIIRYTSYGGVSLTNSNSSLTNNQISDNIGYGLLINSGTPTISNNSFSNNSRHLCQGLTALPSYSGNTFSGTGGQAIAILGGTLASGDTTWINVQNMNWPYLLLGSLTINSGATLHLPAGTVVKLIDDGYGYTSLTVNGVLDVQGTAASRVVFTSYRDDLNGGDTNGDGSATTPAPGDWQGIYLYNSAITLNYTLIQYAGGYKNPSYALTINNASPTISNNIIRYSRNGGISVTGGSPSITGNAIMRNSQYGLYKASAPTLIAENNWWGDASGPYHPTTNPSGKGDKVSDNVDFVPWLTTGPLEPKAWTLMYYFDGDTNDVDSDGIWTDAIHELEKESNNSNVNIVTLRIRRGGDSAYYLLNKTGTYTEGQNYWPKGILDAAYSQTLIDFVGWARQEFPANHYALIMSDHGSGLAGAMRADSQNRSSPMTLEGIQYALHSITFGGLNKIDVLYMNACLMGMIEDGYQFRNYVNYYVASENVKIAPKTEYGDAISDISQDTTPLYLATRFASSYFNILLLIFKGGLTISVADLTKADSVATSVSLLAQAIKVNMSANVPALQSAFDEVQLFDNKEPKGIDRNDTYGDLYDVARLIKLHSSDPSVRNAAQGVMDAVSNYIVYNRNALFSGVDNAHGVSILVPKERNSFYDGEICDFAQGTDWWGTPPTLDVSQSENDPVGWGSLLVSYFNITQPGGPDDPNVPPAVAMIPIYNIYLPLIKR
jgi:parallel beta-helix repeat protein